MTDLPQNPPPQFDPSQPYSPPPAPGVPVIQPVPKKGPSALKIVLIVVAVFAGLAIIGLGIVGYGVYKFAKSSHVTASTQPVTASDLGVALYPGAQQGKASVHMTIVGKSMTTASFLTADPMAEVTAFYQNSLGPDAKTSTSANGETLMLNKGSGESVIVTVSQSPGLESGKTQIVIVHATKADTAAQ